MSGLVVKAIVLFAWTRTLGVIGRRGAGSGRAAARAAEHDGRGAGGLCARERVECRGRHGRRRAARAGRGGRAAGGLCACGGPGASDGPGAGGGAGVLCGRGGGTRGAAGGRDGRADGDRRRGDRRCRPAGGSPGHGRDRTAKGRPIEVGCPAGGPGAGRVPDGGDGSPRRSRGRVGGAADAVPGGDAGAARRDPRRGRIGRRVPRGRGRPARELRDTRVPRDVPYAGDVARAGLGRGLGGRGGRRRAGRRRGDHGRGSGRAIRGSSTGIGIGIASAKPRNRANRHCRWRAYQSCRAWSLVRRVLVASTAGLLPMSRHPAADPIAALLYYIAVYQVVRTRPRENCVTACRSGPRSP